MQKDGDPSFEEILRSIKQVISREDGENAPTTPDNDGGEPRHAGSGTSLNLSGPFSRRHLAPEPANEPESDGARGEDVYDLAALPGGDVPAEPAEIAPDEPIDLPAAFTIPDSDPADDQFSVGTDADSNFENDRYAEIGSAFEPAEDAESESRDDPIEAISEAIAPSPEPENAFEQETPPEPAQQPAPDASAEDSEPDTPSVDNGLIANAAAAAMREQLDALSSVSASQPSAPAPANPLEEVVREMLRPMLREWLDANLQGIIERMVQDEIARITGRR